MDELTNISFNYDANTSVHNNSNHNGNNQNSNANNDNQSLKNNNLDESDSNSVHSDELDELAMLCSGQFRGKHFEIFKLCLVFFNLI